MKNTMKGNAQQPTLAELLSGVMNHPDTPVEIYNDIQDALCDLGTKAARQQSPEYIARVLIENGIQDDPASETTEHAADEASEPQTDIDDLRTDHVFKAATFKDARRIANGETLQSKEWTDEEMSDLLTLMFSLTYCEQQHREGILYEVIRAFIPIIDRAQNAVELMVVERYKGARA